MAAASPSSNRAEPSRADCPTAQRMPAWLHRGLTQLLNPSNPLTASSASLESCRKDAEASGRHAQTQLCKRAHNLAIVAQEARPKGVSYHMTHIVLHEGCRANKEGVSELCVAAVSSKNRASCTLERGPVGSGQHLG